MQQVVHVVFNFFDSPLFSFSRLSMLCVPYGLDAVDYFVFDAVPPRWVFCTSSVCSFFNPHYSWCSLLLCNLDLWLWSSERCLCSCGHTWFEPRFWAVILLVRQAWFQRCFHGKLNHVCVMILWKCCVNIYCQSCVVPMLPLVDCVACCLAEWLVVVFANSFVFSSFVV